MWKEELPKKYVLNSPTVTNIVNMFFLVAGMLIQIKLFVMYGWWALFMLPITVYIMFKCFVRITAILTEVKE